MLETTVVACRHSGVVHLRQAPSATEAEPGAWTMHMNMYEAWLALVQSHRGSGLPKS